MPSLRGCKHFRPPTLTRRHPSPPPQAWANPPCHVAIQALPRRHVATAMPAHATPTAPRHHDTRQLRTSPTVTPLLHSAQGPVTTNTRHHRTTESPIVQPHRQGSIPRHRLHLAAAFKPVAAHDPVAMPCRGPNRTTCHSTTPAHCFHTTQRTYLRPPSHRNTASPAVPCHNTGPGPATCYPYCSTSSSFMYFFDS
ncbi:hypothetical protein EDB89DRAFT_2239761, partial [Lactarius sanguifluus]